jgi:thiamine pyrophosphokinase
VSGHSGLHAILVGDGDVPALAALDEAWPGWDADAALVVAADGGATKAMAAGLAPDLVVGDGDSLGPAGLASVREAGIPIEPAAEAKDESDLELAVLAALARGATRFTILGALGGPRFDHALANAWLLALPALAGRPAILLDGATRVRLLDASAAPVSSEARVSSDMPAPVSPAPSDSPLHVSSAAPASASPGSSDSPASAVLGGRVGDLVSLFPFGDDALGVATDGLAYQLRDEPLRFGPARGLSNVRSSPEARVSLRAGRLLIVETRHPEGAIR